MYWEHFKICMSASIDILQSNHASVSQQRASLLCQQYIAHMYKYQTSSLQGYFESDNETIIMVSINGESLKIRSLGAEMMC